MISSRRRFAAVGFLSAVVLLALGAIVYAEQQNGSANITVFELVRGVTAGSPYSPADVEQVQVRAAPDDFNYENLGPQQFPARYAVTLNARDILRSDDLIADSAQSEVAISVVNPPPISPGDQLDVYATLPAGVEALIGRDVTVDSVDGGTLTVLVPVSDEASWIAISASATALHVARTVPGAQLSPNPLDSNEAIRILCGAPCAASVSASANTP